jgi:hypothetical protein
MVGNMARGGTFSGFTYQQGKIIEVMYPGKNVIRTDVNGVNNPDQMGRYQIVGNYYVEGPDELNPHAFMATVYPQVVAK